MNSITVTIPKGKNTSWAFDRLLLRVRLIFWFYLRRRKLRVFVRFLSDPYDTKGDKDLMNDISKIFGFNLQAWAPSDENSIMMGFRSNYENSKWDITPYANVGGADLKGLKTRKVAASVAKGELFMFDITPEDNDEFTIELFTGYESNGGKWYSAGSVTHEYPVRTWIGSLIGPWHGGLDDDENDLGGVAPEDVKIDIQWEFIRK